MSIYPGVNQSDNPEDDDFRIANARLVSGKHAGGRPTKYKAEFCESLVDHMTQGYSFESFAATIGTHRDTLYEWTGRHKKFSDAKKRGTDAAQLFYEKIGMAGMMGKIDGFQSGMWMFQMKARFKWRDHFEEESDTGMKEFEAAFNDAIKLMEERKKGLSGK